MGASSKLYEPGLESGLYNTICFDGGGTTGWALMSVRTEYFHTRSARLLDNVVFWAAGQYVGWLGAQVADAAELVEAWAPQYPNARAGDWAPVDNLAVVAEDFTLRQFRMDSTLLLPVEFNAGLKQELWRFTPRRLLFKQQPGLAMSTVTDDRLAEADAYVDAELRGRGGGYHASTRGKPHARDALRHAFTFLQREKSARWEGRTLVPVGGGGEGVR
jgi:hypothetical protein